MDRKQHKRRRRRSGRVKSSAATRAVAIGESRIIGRRRRLVVADQQLDGARAFRLGARSPAADGRRHRSGERRARKHAEQKRLIASNRRKRSA